MAVIEFFDEYNNGQTFFKKYFTDQIEEVLIEIAEQEGCEIASLTFIALDDNALLQMNKDFLNHDYYTDVITFDLSEGDELEGEVYMSADRIKENASEYKVPVVQELCRVIFHGLLHLIGYNDKGEDEVKLMSEKENYYLEKYSSTWNSNERNV